MTSSSEQSHLSLIDGVAKLVRKRVKGRGAKEAERFVRAFYARVPPDDISDQPLENLAGAALYMWGVMAERKPGRAKVRVYNPDEKTHGWEVPATAIEIINDDMPFLVDSVTAEVNRQGAEVLLIIHPILTVERDSKGKLKHVGPAEDPDVEGRPESCMLVLVNEMRAEAHAELAAGLEATLSEVRAAVHDWRAMRQRCRDLIDELDKTPPRLPKEEVSEGLAFLEWLDTDHFTFLGYREYNFQGQGAKAIAKIDPSSGLGVLSDPKVSIFNGMRNLGQLPADVQAWLKTPELLRITKSNRHSRVHRPIHMDAIAVKKFNRKGEVVGERLFVGLFTSVAYSSSPRQIPLLREKVDQSLESAGLVPGSHDGKALLHILETYPRDELFQIEEEDLVRIAVGILHLQERQRTALFVRRDPFERFVSCMVFVPRDRYDTMLRLKLQSILAEAFQGRVTSYSSSMADQPLARLHVIISTTQGAIPALDHSALEEMLAEAVRSWGDRLRDALIAEHGQGEGWRLGQRYVAAFPLNYQDMAAAKDAVADIRNIEEALTTGRLAMDLYRPHKAPDSTIHFKLYIVGGPIPLSDVLPMLENMGLKVMSEVPYEVLPVDSAEPVWIHDFDMTLKSGTALDIGPIRQAFHEAFDLVWRGEMDNDGFNRLVLLAGLSAREIRILRAYSKYLRQAGIPFSQAYMEDTLAGHPGMAGLLAELFVLRFDPEIPGARARKAAVEKLAARQQEVAEEIRQRLEDVSSLDEDRIIRGYLNLIENTLRTSFFQTDPDGAPKRAFAFKLDSRRLEELPAPRPFREIFVYGPRVEGVHLRFGKVARGGLRWSDRREDFRTEVLGLVKAQQVKNAVIVPVGSKGGFVPKRLPPPEEGRAAWLEEGKAAYRTFIGGMLDVTDNIKSGKIEAPTDVVRYDEDDPYLVVAADKGTATFSDIANGISLERGFWLDDAFASGGSAGYDHKAMGITARGAWESVKRHFREMGKNIQTTDFTVVGVGDMGGDVFGNGMLLSKHIRLLGAFNHLHVFVDPGPDAAASWAERKRLFDTPGTTWADYDTKLISKGGGVFDRKAKSIKVTAEMKACFGLTKDSVTPTELIRAILLSDVELLWFGGIGTYVKAAIESDADVGDRANDALRINGADLKARVVGEGANLGMTQRARIEYALDGGRLNTDAIDNSAGVDCSDHEVNIKILLGAVEQTGKMTRPQRDRLLRKMTDEVAELVLRDNYLQTQSISVTSQLGCHLLDRLGRFIRSLERAGQLDRALEFLPDDETLQERQQDNLGLTRPELSVLLAYAKIVLYDELLESSLPDDPFLAQDLMAYFPRPLQENHADAIAQHSLRREIVATTVTNGIVNRMGITFVHEVRERTGMPPEEVARAYVIAREVFGVEDLWAEIETLDNKVSSAVQSAMLIECGRLTERIAVWLLRHEQVPLNIEACIESYAKGAKELADGLMSLLGEGDRTAIETEAARLSDLGVPGALALRIASLPALAPACDIIRVARKRGISVTRSGEAYFQVGERFGFDWLRRAAGGLPRDSAWDKLAVSAIVDDLYGYQYELTMSVLDGAKAKGNGAAEIDGWCATRGPLVTRTAQLLHELQAAAKPELAMLAVANRQIKSMVGGI